MQLDTRGRKPMIDDDWHAPILVILGVLLAWNLMSAWFSVRSGVGSHPTALQLRAMHFRVFASSLAYSMVSLALGVGRARRGGSIAPYGLVAVVAMLAAVAVLFSTFGVRTIG